MANDFSDYTEAYLLDHLITSKTLYVGAFTVTPGETGGGTEIPTAGGSAYTREQVAWAAGAQVSGIYERANSAEVAHDAAGTDWGLVIAAALFDSITVGSGNLISFKALPQSKDIRIGDILRYPVGSLKLGLG